MRLHQLANTSRPKKRRKLLGRGPSSGRGKTSGRGHKGDGSRSGYKRRHGYEGGGVPLHRRLPTRGFSNARFSKKLDVINLKQIEALYQEGETVSLETLREKNFLKGTSYGVKLLGNGELKKKLSFKVEKFSSAAKEKLKKINIDV